MIVDGLLLVLGMALLVGGGRALVGGASQLASAFGISELTIGLTVVAFGTSAPELAVNTLAALRGNAAIAFGNIIGSNFANIGLVLGFCALIRSLQIESVIVRRELPMMVLATLVTVVLGIEQIRGEAESYDRADGLVLLLLFSVFLYYSITEVLAARSTDQIAQGAVARAPSGDVWTAGRALLLGAFGLGLLMAGAQLTVTSAVAVAEALGVPRVLIGFTIVALGTSLPELVTSVVATTRGQTSLAVGNIVGSNLFNLLFILGTTAVIRPVEVPPVGGVADLSVLLLLTLGLLVMVRVGESSISRREGVGLLLAYFGYVTWRVAS